MTTLSPTSVPNQNLFFSIRNLLFWLFLFVFSNSFSQQITKGVDKIDSTVMTIGGFPTITPIEGIDAHFEYFWILGNGNFITNTRSDTVRERYVSTVGTSASSYDVKAYTTSIYIGTNDEPTKRVIDESIITTTSAQGVTRTQAVDSAFLHLQFNHNEIIPNDTTIWVLSVKNPLTANEAFIGEVYLFFNSPIKIYESPIKIDPSKGKVYVDPKEEQLLINDLNIDGDKRYGEFKYNASFIYNRDFREQAYQIQNINGLNDSYKDGILWHFDTLAAGEERHLFIEFQDPDNLFDNGKTNGGTTPRVVDFLAALVINDPQATIPDSLTGREDSIVSAINLNNFINNISSHEITTEPPFPIDDNAPILGRRILDIFTVQTKAKRAHDPNLISIQACTCPPNSDGAQKLILTVECENDGEASTTEVKISIPLPPEIDASSITGEFIAYHLPGIESSSAIFTYKEEDNTLNWHFPSLQLYGVKEIGGHNESTYAQFTFTALTVPGTDMSAFPEMYACIDFTDEHGPLPSICTPHIKPELLTKEEANRGGVAESLSCETCIIEGCNFPIWLICLMVAVLIFGLWIIFSKKEEN